MVQGNSSTATGSIGREYTLTFEIRPPTSVRPGVPFTLPVIVAARPIGAVDNEPGQQLVANISLHDETGTTPLAGLTGSLSSVLCNRTWTSTSGYASFRRLTITNTGRYRLRVKLAAHAYSGATVIKIINSAVIDVNAAAAASQRPSRYHAMKNNSTLQSYMMHLPQSSFEPWLIWQSHPFRCGTSLEATVPDPGEYQHIPAGYLSLAVIGILTLKYMLTPGYFITHWSFSTVLAFTCCICPVFSFSQGSIC